jgi:hypothetical protein
MSTSVIAAILSGTALLAAAPVYADSILVTFYEGPSGYNFTWG